MFTIRNSISLLLFEVAHIIESGSIINKCENCGNFFIPNTRIDTIYCNYPSPQNKSKTCKEIGAQITRSKKEKTDEFTYEYRKIYMRLQMKSRRNSQKKEYSLLLKKMVKESKGWREKLKEGNVIDEEWKEWLKGFL